MTAACLDDELVLGLVEGRLAPPELASVDDHLDGCASCRELVVQLSRARTTTQVLERGSQLGRYVIGELLGAGAMGRVYSAWQPELDRRVAIKVLQEDGPGGRERLVREAQAMARLDHPNVVGVYEVGSTDGGVYVVMDLVEGETLRAWAERRRPWRDVVRVLIETARGIAAVHAAGVVHRDVKPDNVIVGADGRARLGDFGLARSGVGASSAPGSPGAGASSAPGSPGVGASSAPPTLGAGASSAPPSFVGTRLAVGTPATAIAGTPAYMAPEVLRGGPAGEASDQFGFGITAYEVLSGARPFEGRTWAELSRAIERGAIPALRDVPGWLDAAIRRCLAVDPARRFGSLAAVADHLAQRSQRRRPVAWISGAAVAAVAASTATWLAVRDGGAALAPCDGGAAEISQVWSPARLAQLGALSDPSRAALDGWAAAWAVQRDASCRAARTEPAPRVAARDRCLDQRRAELAALLDQLAAGRGDAVDRGARADGPESARTTGAAGAARGDVALRAEDARKGESSGEVEASGVVGDAAEVAASRVVGDTGEVEASRVVGDARVVESSRVVGDERAAEGSGVGDARVVESSRVVGNERAAEGSGVGDARVVDGSRAVGDVRVVESSRVVGDARVVENSRVVGNERAVDGSRVVGDARVVDGSRVVGDARVVDGSRAVGDARVIESSRVVGNERAAEGSGVGDARVVGNERAAEGSGVGEPRVVDTRGSENALGRGSETAPARRAERLIDALAALPPSECAAAGPSTADALPLDPARAAIAREVQAQLVPVRAAIALGDARPFVEPTAALVDRARESGHAPTVAEAELARAEVLRAASRLGDAAVSARDAAAAAERGRDDLAAARAWIARVAIAGDRRDLAIAEDLAALAGAAVDRAGAPPRLAGQLLRLRGLVAFNRGQLDEARRLLSDARARFVEASGERSIEVASVESALGIVAREQGQLELAERHHRAALEISRVLRGPQHPEIARDLHNLAGVRRKLGDLDGAAAHYRDALAIMIATRGPRSAEAGLTHNSLGLVHMARSDWAAARTELELARDALAAAGHGDRVFAEHNLGLVAARTGDHRTALAQFAIAAPLYAATLGADAPAAIQLQIDRARSAAALGERTEARGLATSARAAATRANLRYVIDESDALLAELAAAMRPGPAVARGPGRARRDLRADPDPDAAPIRSISIEPPPAIDRPVTQPTLVDVPPPPRPPVPAQAPQPQRDVGTYGSSQGW